MLRVTTPKDLTTALVKEDLKAREELTARVRFWTSIPNHQNQNGTFLSSKTPGAFSNISVNSFDNTTTFSFICYRNYGAASEGILSEALTEGLTLET